MLLNIEIKAPVDAKRSKAYNTDMAAEKVIELIKKYDIGPRVVISSFTPKVIKSVEKASMPPEDRTFIIQPLINVKGKTDPHNYVVQDHMSGLNMNYEFLNKERTSKVTKNKKLLGVWLSHKKTNKKENK